MYFQAKISLCEILIFELKSTGNRDTLNDIDKLFTDLVDLTEENKLISYQIEMMILKSRLSLIEEDLDGVDNLLKKALQLAEEKEIDFLIPKIKDEINKFTENIQLWNKLATQGSSFLELIQESQMEEYLQRVLKIKKEIS